jgi:hypothetical protein
MGSITGIGYLPSSRISISFSWRGQTSAKGRVGMWRGGVRSSMSVSAPFVWRCLSGPTACTGLPGNPEIVIEAQFFEQCLGKMPRFRDTDATLDSMLRFMWYCGLQAGRWKRREP